MTGKQQQTHTWAQCIRILQPTSEIHLLFLKSLVLISASPLLSNLIPRRSVDTRLCTLSQGFSFPFELPTSGCPRPRILMVLHWHRIPLSFVIISFGIESGINKICLTWTKKEGPLWYLVSLTCGKLWPLIQSGVTDGHCQIAWSLHLVPWPIGLCFKARLQTKKWTNEQKVRGILWVPWLFSLCLVLVISYLEKTSSLGTYI
jgi:hypothetical protein